MIVRLDITDENLMKCDFILNTVIFIDAALNISLRSFENEMLYGFIYLAEGFRMRPKVRSTLIDTNTCLHTLQMFVRTLTVGAYTTAISSSLAKMNK